MHPMESNPFCDPDLGAAVHGVPVPSRPQSEGYILFRYLYLRSEYSARVSIQSATEERSAIST